MTTLFNSNPPSYNDPSDAYANEKKLYLSFFHVASRKKVSFKAFVTDYGESFATQWNGEQVFGRNDPIMTFQSTKRTIRVAWDVPAASLSEAKENMRKCDLLAQFMYPAYAPDRDEHGNALPGSSSPGRANTLSKPPLMRIRFANLIRGTGDSADAQLGGLLAAVSSLSVAPAFGDEGFFDPDQATLYPKLIKISCDFTALHEHRMGWSGDEGNIFGNPERGNFPWGLPGEPDPSLSDAQAVEDVMNEGPPSPPEDPAVARSVDEQETAQQLADEESAASVEPFTDLSIEEWQDQGIEEELSATLDEMAETDSALNQYMDDIRVDQAIRRWGRIRDGQESLAQRSSGLHDALENLSVLDEGMTNMRNQQRQRAADELLAQQELMRNATQTLDEGATAIRNLERSRRAQQIREQNEALRAARDPFMDTEQNRENQRLMGQISDETRDNLHIRRAQDRFRVTNAAQLSRAGVMPALAEERQRQRQIDSLRAAGWSEDDIQWLLQS